MWTVFERNQYMKISSILALSTALIVLGCSSGNKIANKNPVPKYNNLAYLDFKKASRAPASFQNKTTSLVKSSNKTVYFLGLYDQFHNLRKMTGNKEESLNSCPRFHNVFIDYNKTHRISLNEEEKSFWDKNFLRSIIERNLQNLSFPELSLTTPTENKAISEIASLKEEDIASALANHISNTKNELTKICTTGNSENYFIFENLVTYLERNPGFKNNEKAFKTLMKTTLFSNMVLIKSLEEDKKGNRTIASGYNYIEEEVLLRLNASWTKPLINDVKQAKRK